MFFIEFIFLPYEKKIVFSIFYYLGEKFAFKFLYFLVFMGFYKSALIT